ncbi:thioredoxin family protein [Thermoflavimicrobium dichotomicum]|uniref:Thioredoxin n=1 Tax=Thermoflavimicrobium dichotomicum TaxID=46223 RepID=A0A1I3TS72_9BACL|nr:thioredoxin family protein [Thermoflavimicrobium dichotomicum]SFJ73323.1 Thioredoxin [Thermoflavimicrobium dichotomicum]
MTLNDWFQKGMTYQEYVDSMQINREELLSIYENVYLSEEEKVFFAQGKSKNWRIIVLTADWCGDAMLCVPIMKRIAEVASFDMRFLIRDDNLELMDQYLTNGTARAIPIFIFIDEKGQEKAVWGPRAPEVQQMITEMRSALPPKEDPTFEQKQKEMYREFREKICTDRTIWKAVKRSVKEKLEQVFQMG